MNNLKHLRTAIIILIIVLVAVISFVGFYVSDKNTMTNIIPGYSYGMELSKYRVFILKPNDGTKTVKYKADGTKYTEDDYEYDSNGQVVEPEGLTEKEEKINPDEVLTEANFNTSKGIIENRLKDYFKKTKGLIEQDTEFEVKQDENGTLYIRVPEDQSVDYLIGELTDEGSFEVTDSETGEILLNNDDLKEVKAGYTSNGEVSIVFVMNGQGARKLEKVTTEIIDEANEANQIALNHDLSQNAEIETAAEGEDVATVRQITIKIDGSELLTTNITEPIRNGQISLTYNESSNVTIESALRQSVMLSSGKLPVQYSMNDSNGKTHYHKVIYSEITEPTVDMIRNIAYVCLAIIVVILILFFRRRGLLGALALIGNFALILLLIRIGNVKITISSLVAIGVATLLEIVFITSVLIHKDEKINKKAKGMIKAIVPLLLMSVVFSFTPWLELSSFGNVIFWEALIITPYNLLITKYLLDNNNEFVGTSKKEDKEEKEETNKKSKKKGNK